MDRLVRQEVGNRLVIARARAFRPYGVAVLPLAIEPTVRKRQSTDRKLEH
jgi:hypothetical protein